MAGNVWRVTWQSGAGGRWRLPNEAYFHDNPGGVGPTFASPSQIASACLRAPRNDGSCEALHTRWDEFSSIGWHATDTLEAVDVT